MVSPDKFCAARPRHLAEDLMCCVTETERQVGQVYILADYFMTVIGNVKKLMSLKSWEEVHWVKKMHGP